MKKAVSRSLQQKVRPRDRIALYREALQRLSQQGADPPPVPKAKRPSPTKPRASSRRKRGTDGGNDKPRAADGGPLETR
jgi:hypothetical protein